MNAIHSISVFLSDNPDLARGLLVFTVLFFIIGLLSIPYLIGKIPHDYFLSERRSWKHSFAEYGLLFIVYLVGKNVLGVILFIAGFLMLFLPGQGLLTLFISLLLLDFPGKYHTERWLIQREGISRSINWVRSRQNLPPVIIPD